MKFASVSLALLVCCGLVWICAPSTFTLRNGSGKSIRSLSVEVSGKTLHYEDIPVGGEVSGSFHFNNEDSFDVQGQFADGTEFADFCGYLLWQDFESHRVLILRPDGMVCEQRYHVTPTALP